MVSHSFKLFIHAPPSEVFVKVTGVFTQAIVSGEIVKSALGNELVVIGSTVAEELAQGFTASIRI